MKPWRLLAFVTVALALLVVIAAQPAIAQAFETQGMTPAFSTPQAFHQLMVADAKRWTELIKAQHITAE